RVVDGEVHHRHGPANKDGVLAALGRGLKSSDVPVKDLVGRARTRHSEAGQSQHSEDTYYLRESSGILLHGKIPLVVRQRATAHAHAWSREGPPLAGDFEIQPRSQPKPYSRFPRGHGCRE